MVIEGSDSGPKDIFANLGEFASVVPYALAFLSNDGPAALKDQLRVWAKKDPMDALLGMVLGGGLAFYLTERDSNTACKTPWDGVLYMATALSGGHTLAPTTHTGHTLATFAQTFGPALALAAFDPPASDKLAKEAEAAAVDRAILARLEDIVRLLEAKT